MRALGLAILSLIFISKLSLEWLGFIPFQVPVMIFQHGMHPYLNSILNIVLGIPLIALWLGLPVRGQQHPFYQIFLFLLAAVLSVQTLIQILYIHPEHSIFFQLAGLGLALYLILLFGVVLPSVLKGKDALDWLWGWSALLTLLSLLFLFIFPEQVYKGGRFIGVFKHIPYMVTCATLSFVFTLSRFFNGERTRAETLAYALLMLASFYAILLTGTRSSAFAAVLAVILGVAFMPTLTTHLRVIKVMVVSVAATGLLFFGSALFEAAHGVVRGDQSLMGRAAQDGVATRWEEVERGMNIFEQHPLTGMGILFRFMDSSTTEVGGYNSMKDPHNIFVSAGVVGGWPLVMLSLVGFSMIVWGAFSGLFDPIHAYRWMAIYLLVHAPILLIYHVHLSLGGMADRVYWLIFGFVALKVSRDQFYTNIAKP